MKGYPFGWPEIMVSLDSDGVTGLSGPEIRQPPPALRAEAGHGRPVLFIGPPCSNLGKNGVLGHKGPGRHYLEALALQQVLELCQGVVIVPVAIDCHCYGGTAAPL